MNIYLISQDQNDDYDTFDSAVVIAPNEEAARRMHPCGGTRYWKETLPTWCDSPDVVKVELIRITHETTSRVVCASFNAG